MAKAATQGTKLYVEDPDTPDTYLAVGNLTSIRTPSPDKPEIDVTDLDSTGAEFLLGIPDFGNLDFTGFYNPDSPGQEVLKEDGASTESTVRSFRIELTSLEEQIEFEGIVKSFVIEAGLNNAYTFNGTIRTTGAPTFGAITS